MVNFSETILWVLYIASLYFTIFWILVFLSSRKKFIKERNVSKLSKFPFISIIIPAYNEEVAIESTIKSVLNLNYPKDKLEVIVVNDGSVDNTQKVVERFIKRNKNNKVKLINQENQGKAKSLNNALNVVNGEFFACLDADSFVQRDTLKKMILTYHKYNDKDLVIVTPAMKIKKPKNLVQKLQRVEYFVMMFVARLMSSIDCIYVAPGPFSLYKTQVIRDLGGFDEHNLTEDQEIAYRVQKNHYRIKQCYNAYVYTGAPKSIPTLYKQRNRWFKGGLFNIIKYKKIMFNKEYGDFGMMQMMMNAFYFVLSLFAVSLFGYYFIWPFLKGIRNFYLVGFDWRPYITDIINFELKFMNINVEKVFILISVLTLSLIIFFIAHRNADESIKKHGTIYLFLYFFIYYIGLGIIEVIVLFEYLIGKRQKW